MVLLRQPKNSDGSVGFKAAGRGKLLPRERDELVQAAFSPSLSSPANSGKFEHLKRLSFESLVSTDSPESENVFHSLDELDDEEGVVLKNINSNTNNRRTGRF